jgi:stringent starvation protein B
MSDSSSPMSPSRPYLLRALNEWIVDNGATPQILIDSTNAEVEIPDSVRTRDKVVLNISPNAVRDLQIDNEFVSFVARFSGVSHGVLVPIDAVEAIYARENGQGMMFPEPEPGADADGVDDDASDDGQSQKKGKPDLKVIK